MGLSWASHGTLIYTSELILCSIICVHSATRHNIHMYHHLNSGARLLLELYRVVVIKQVAFFTIWVKLTMPFTCTSLPLNLYTSVFAGGCDLGFEQKFWRIDGFGIKRHESVDLPTPIHPPPGDDQLFEYEDDFSDDSDGFVVEEDGHA